MLRMDNRDGYKQEIEMGDNITRDELTEAFNEHIDAYILTYADIGKLLLADKESQPQLAAQAERHAQESERTHRELQNKVNQLAMQEYKKILGIIQ